MIKTIKNRKKADKNDKKWPKFKFNELFYVE